ncbi:MAG: radical SAM protein [Lentisphaerae bacterium]|nr:radical SAM protein [Lentisphaerota bacterium]
MNKRILVLQPPSPPGLSIMRDIIGGYGAAFPSKRADYGHDDWVRPEPNMVLFYTAAVCEQGGREVHFLDAQAEFLNLDQTAGRVAAVRPDVVVSIVSLPSVKGDLAVLARLKAQSPGLTVVAIGITCKALPELVLKDGVVDYAVQGAPEYVVPDLVRALEEGSRAERVPGLALRRVPQEHADACAPSGDSSASLRSARNDMGRRVIPSEVEGSPAGGTTSPCLQTGAMRRHGDVFRTSAMPPVVTDLDALPYPAYHLARMDLYWHHLFGRETRYIVMLASKGCPYGCYYCPYPFGFGDTFVFRDPVKVADEIQHVCEKYGVRAIVFRDQVFTASPSRVHRLCDEIIRRGLRLRWLCETRFENITPDLLRKMKAAGCIRINYGIESGDPEIFSAVGKALAREPLEQVLERIALTERCGIYAHVFILLGLYGENRASIRKTMDMVRRVKSTTIGVTIATPYPGTAFFDEAKAKGMLLTEDWSRFTSYDPVIRTEELSAEDLLKARDEMHRIHRRAVRWKRMRQLIALNLRRLRDGTLWRHVAYRLRKQTTGHR